ncbi:MAG: hypothetical protein ABR926_26965 [Streptosporangiaceae bacterium]|jgi:hypothetical protein
MILGVSAVVVVAVLITSLAQRRRRGVRLSGPVPPRQFPPQQQSSPGRSWRPRSWRGRSWRRRSARRRPAAARRRLRPDEERILAELDATWEPGYADRVTALLRPDADVDLPPS